MRPGQKSGCLVLALLVEFENGIVIWAGVTFVKDVARKFEEAFGLIEDTLATRIIYICNWHRMSKRERGVRVRFLFKNSGF